MFQVYFEYINNLGNEVYFKYTLNFFLKCMYLFSDSEVYLKQNFKIYVVVAKLRSILEVDFLNLQIYIQT